MSFVRRMAAFIFVASIALIAGCATTPAPETMRAEIAGYQLPQLPADGQAMVYILRPGPEVYLAGMSPNFIYVEEADKRSKIGYTRSGQYISIELPPGEHRIRSGAAFEGRAEITLNAGDIVFLKQFVGLVGLSSLEPIDEVQGKHLMKSKALKLGTVQTEES